MRDPDRTDFRDVEPHGMLTTQFQTNDYCEHSAEVDEPPCVDCLAELAIETIESYIEQLVLAADEPDYEGRHDWLRPVYGPGGQVSFVLNRPRTRVVLPG